MSFGARQRAQDFQNSKSIQRADFRLRKKMCRIDTIVSFSPLVISLLSILSCTAILGLPFRYAFGRLLTYVQIFLGTCVALYAQRTNKKVFNRCDISLADHSKQNNINYIENDIIMIRFNSFYYNDETSLVVVVQAPDYCSRDTAQVATLIRDPGLRF